jgi:peptidoglycan/LPS O-acetylase OafA/YrhL
VASPAAPLIFAIPSFFALLPMKWAGLEDPPSFVPQARIVAAYTVPFAFGWLLYRNAGLLAVIRDRAWVYAGAALVPCVFYIGLVRIPLPRAVSFYADRAVHSLALWLLIFGLTGLFLRYMNGHSARMRYLSDASYFLYLAHMPVILVLQLAFEGVPWHPLLKIPVVLAISVPVLLAMYHYGVRPTFVGAALNGRRYPIGRAEAVPVPA